VSDLRITGRIAQGVKLIDLAEGDRVAAVTRIVLGKRLHETGLKTSQAALEMIP
jgi:DNA gyrase/topoisomerase IV subunit A